jgi:hypothetical protein
VLRLGWLGGKFAKFHALHLSPFSSVTYLSVTFFREKLHWATGGIIANAL